MAYGDGVEVGQIRQLINLVDGDANTLVSLSLAKSSRELDMKEAVLETILVEMANMDVIRLFPNGYGSCRVTLRNGVGPKQDVLVDLLTRFGVRAEVSKKARIFVVRECVIDALYVCRMAIL